MDNKLLLKILELLEETYPESYSVERLTGKLRVSIDGEFSKITKYLGESKKITIMHNGTIITGSGTLEQRNRITITNEGIDFLLQKKLLKAEEIRNKIIVGATITIAIVGIISLISIFS